MTVTPAARPRLRADVRLTPTAGGMLVRRGETALLVRGPAADDLVRLAPRLTGASTVRGLCAGLPADERRTLLQLVALLLRHDCARDAAHDDQDPPPGDLRRCRVLLRSRWPAAAPVVAAAARTLLRSGVPAIDIAADLPGRDRAALAADAAEATLRFVSPHRAGRGHTVVASVEPVGGPGEATVPAFVGDGVVVIGAGTCPACTRLRLLTNRAPGAGVPAAPDGARAAIAGTLLGVEILAAVRAHRPAPAVLVLDLATSETRRERLLPHPGCTHPDGVVDATPADLVAPHVGVLAGYADDAATQLPLRVGAVRLAYPAQTVVAYDASTVDAARAAAVRAAVAVYSEAVLPDGPLRWAPFTGGPVPAPSATSTAGVEAGVGVGVGTDLADAVAAGLCQVLAGEAARTGPCRPVDPAALAAPGTLDLLLRTAARSGLPVHLSAPADAAIPVVIARAPGSAPAVGWGDDPAAAAAHALLSLLGPRQLTGAGRPQPALGTATLLPGIERWLRDRHRDAWYADITPADVARTGLTVVRTLLSLP
ncbi:hypothetical protein AB0J72_55400 [Dactylosporangium sp. NPDC049742]|uniref:hypothetical protein n=1 Tax=Dactylosporangium sp. NPDC049742 TaxID=3154737 RepID=UPI003428F074